MTQPIQLTDNVFAVEAPDPGNAIISGNIITWKNSQAQGRGFITLPPGNWQLICTTKEVTEDIAKSIVDAHGKHFRDYSRDFHGIPLTVFTAPESLETLLTSKGLDPNKNYVLIKKLP